MKKYLIIIVGSFVNDVSIETFTADCRNEEEAIGIAYKNKGKVAHGLDKFSLKIVEYDKIKKI